MSKPWVGCDECRRGEEHLCAPDPEDGHNLIMDLPEISDEMMAAASEPQPLIASCPCHQRAIASGSDAYRCTCKPN
jgi:hypothetical protein